MSDFIHELCVYEFMRNDGCSGSLSGTFATLRAVFSLPINYYGFVFCGFLISAMPQKRERSGTPQTCRSIPA